MRRFAGAATAVALLFASATAAPAEAREQSPKCHPRGAAGVAASTRARLFRVARADGGYVVYGCDLLSGRRTRIAAGDRGTTDDLRQVRFAGRVAGFEQRTCASLRPARLPTSTTPASSYAACDPRSGRRTEIKDLTDQETYLYWTRTGLPRVATLD